MSRISEVTKRIVWVKAGGRCHICNDYLLEREDLDDVVFPFGEVAHMVANSEHGPRGDAELTEDERQQPGNLLLLCPTCHTRIDQADTAVVWTKKRLLARKQSHELRIREQTGIGGVESTTIFRLVGQIRGKRMSLSRETIRDAVLNQTGRTINDRSELREYDVDISQLDDTQDYANYLQVASSQIKAEIGEFFRGQLGSPVPSHVSVFAFARIPLLVLAGFEFRRRTQVELFQLQSDGRWGWSDSSNVVDFECLLESDKDSECLNLIVSISGDISLDMLPFDAATNRTICVRPKGVNSSRLLFQSQASIVNFRKKIESAWRLAEAYRPQQILLFCATGLTPSFVIGQEILPNVTPPVEVYDWIDGEYVSATLLKP